MRELTPVVIGAVLLLVSACFSFGAIAQIEPGGNFEGFTEVGDYTEVSFWTDEDGIEMSGNMRMELTCDETVRVQGKNYDCHVISVKGSGEFDSGVGLKGNWEMSGEQYSDKSDGSSVKSELVIEMTMTFQGETAKMTSDATTERLSWSTNWTGAEDPGIGDCWMETEREKTVTKSTADTPDGTETSTDTETVTTVTYYIYVGDENVNSNLGSIECKVIQSYDESDMDYKDENYVVSYMDKDLDIPIKSKTYEDGDLILTNEIVAYKIGSDKAGTEVIGPIGGVEEDKGLFGLGKFAGIDISLILIIIVLVAIVLIIAVLMMRRGHGEPEAPAESRSPGQQPSAPQQPVPPQHLRSPQQQQPRMATFNCPHCGKPFSAQQTEQVQQLYCPSCSGQVTINPQQPRALAPKPSPAPPQQMPKQPPPKQPQQPRAPAPKPTPVPLQQSPKQEPPREPQQPAQEPPAVQPPQEEPEPKQPAQEPPAQKEPELEQSVQEPIEEPQQQPQEQVQEPQQPAEEQPAQTQPTQPSKQPYTTQESPLYILKMRLAKGEIDLETYRELKKEIE